VCAILPGQPLNPPGQLPQKRFHVVHTQSLPRQQ